MTPIHQHVRLDCSATLEDVYREVTNLPSVVQVKTLTEPPIAAPALAVELVDDTSRITVEMLLAPTKWHITDALSERTDRWVKVAPLSGDVAGCLT